MDDLVDTREPAPHKTYMRLLDLLNAWYETPGDPRYLVLSHKLFSDLLMHDEAQELYYARGVGYRWRSCIVLYTEQQDFMELI